MSRSFRRDLIRSGAPGSSGAATKTSKQVSAVAGELASASAFVPMQRALCFVGTDLPWFGDSIGGIPLVGRRGLAKLLKGTGDLAAEDRAALAEFLATRFPVAG